MAYTQLAALDELRAEAAAAGARAAAAEQRAAAAEEQLADVQVSVTASYHGGAELII